MFIRGILTVVILGGIGGLLYMDHAHGTDVGFNLIIFAIVVLSVQEFYDLSRLKGYTPWAVWGTACGGLMVLADWLGHRNIRPELHWMGIVAFVFLSGLFILQGWLRPRREGVVSMALTAMGIVYVWGLAHFFVRLYYFRPESVGPLRDTFGIRGILLTVAVVKAGDIFAYLAGFTFGRHRPFPQISPKKSWEGYIGGVAASLIVAVALGGWLFGMSWWTALVFGVPVAVFGHLGDLAESVIKRDLGASAFSSRRSWSRCCFRCTGACLWRHRRTVRWAAVRDIC